MPFFLKNYFSIWIWLLSLKLLQQEFLFSDFFCLQKLAAHRRQINHSLSVINTICLNSFYIFTGLSLIFHFLQSLELCIVLSPILSWIQRKLRHRLVSNVLKVRSILRWLRQFLCTVNFWAIDNLLLFFGPPWLASTSRAFINTFVKNIFYLENAESIWVTE